MKAAILDDEPHNCQLLAHLLEQFFPEIAEIQQFTDSVDAVEAFRANPPDLLFLDIEMPQLNGFDVLNRLLPMRFRVIFVTAYDKYAVRAFRYSALDYLLKPIDLSLLKEALARAEAKRKTDRINKNFEVFVSNMKTNSQNQQIAISSSDGLIFIKIDNIIYLRGDGAYTYFFLKTGERITVSKNLKEYEDLLSDYDFFRVHKSYLIHLHEMKKYVRGEGGYVVMSNGDSVDVSKRRKEDFLHALSKL